MRKVKLKGWEYPLGHDQYNCRDIKKDPYDRQERRVIENVLKDIGGGDDPIGFLLAVQGAQNALINSYVEKFILLYRVFRAAEDYRRTECDGTPRLWRGKNLQDLANILDEEIEGYLNYEKETIEATEPDSKGSSNDPTEGASEQKALQEKG
jgi:hypothetical protein